MCRFIWIRRFDCVGCTREWKQQILFEDDNKKSKCNSKDECGEMMRCCDSVAAAGSGAHEFVGGDGVVADAYAGGVVDGVGDGGGGSGDADLADASGA